MLGISRVFGRRAAFTLVLSATVAMAAPGCDDPQTAAPAAEEEPVSDLDALLDGAPDNTKLPDEAKSDQVFPAKFTDLVADQSPIKSQGSRGVCSIFSTVALMESLYNKEGTVPNADFSEQFLQWSSKVELKRYTSTGGSSAGANLDTIARYGIVMEEDDPYESRGWGTSDDEACTGKERPTRCYTNGDPSAETLAAKRWYLPTKRYVSSRVRNIKAYMMQNKTGVAAGMQFFYQSWNHGGSKLPVSSDYKAEGYVLYPNQADKDDSGGDRRAGHSILIVGWDDDLEVQSLDKEGNKVVDEEGNPVMQKGFFLFKNSWGTGSFGKRNPNGAGYGWLAYEYVSEYASVVSAREPNLNLSETCGDGKDNDYNGKVDCDDDACASTPACNVPVNDFTGQAFDVPDNDATGASDTISVDTAGFATKVTLTVDMEHTYPADLTIRLTAPSGKSVIVFEKGYGESFPQVFTPAEMVAEALTGDWVLSVVDAAAQDVGSVTNWSLSFEVSAEAPAEVCDDGVDNSGNGMIDCADPACAIETVCDTDSGPWQGLSETEVAIPDNDAAGAESTITISGTGHVASLTALVDIKHTYVGDLTVSLIHPDGTEVVLRREEGSSGDDISELFETDAFNGKSVAGEWKLRVVDGYEQDTGTIASWLLEIQGL